MTIKQAQDKLEAESARYLQLAKEHAFDHINEGYRPSEDGESTARERVIRDHRIRAETFKTAAMFISRP